MPKLTDITTEDGFISLQFSFSNPNAVPPFLRGLPMETPQEAGGRQQRRSGVLIYQGKEGEHASLRSLAMSLIDSDFRLVDALRQERHQRQGRPGGTYSMIRFVFLRESFLEDRSKDEAFQKLQEWQGVIMGWLQVVCSLALWRVRIFRNPFYRDGVEVEDASALSINLEVRTPLYDHDTFLVDIQPKHEPVLELEIG